MSPLTGLMLHLSGVVRTTACARSIGTGSPFNARISGLSFRPAGYLFLCPNIVFTYFKIELQYAILDCLGAALHEGGYLVIGAHEQLPESSLFGSVAGCREVFQKA